MCTEKSWVRQFGTGEIDLGTGRAVDTDGSPYVVGNTLGTFSGQAAFGDRDCYVAGLDSEGTLSWTEQFGTSEYDDCQGVAVAAGFVYAAGTTEGALPTQSNAGETDIFVSRYSSAGNYSAVGVGLDGSNSIYVVGTTRGTFEGETSAGGDDVFLAKFSVSGEHQWTRQFGTSAHDMTQAVSVDAAGNAYVVGDTSGTFAGQVSLGSQDMFLALYGAEGLGWVRQFGTNLWDYSHGVGMDSSGSLYVTGETDGAFAGQEPSGGYDAFLKRLVP